MGTAENDRDESEVVADIEDKGADRLARTGWTAPWRSIDAQVFLDARAAGAPGAGVRRGAAGGARRGRRRPADGAAVRRRRPRHARGAAAQRPDGPGGRADPG